MQSFTPSIASQIFLLEVVVCSLLLSGQEQPKNSLRQALRSCPFVVAAAPLQDLTQNEQSKRKTLSCGIRDSTPRYKAVR